MRCVTERTWQECDRNGANAYRGGVRARRIQLAVVAAALVLGACGGGESTPVVAEAMAGDGRSAGGPLATQASPSTVDDAPTSLGDQVPVEPECTAATSPFGLHYDVAGIPADDADGGLVVRAEPDPAAERVDVLVADTRVETLAGDDTCERLGRSTWWFVAGGGVSGWVNASFLVPSLEQHAVPVAFACALYDELLDARQEDRVPASVAMRLDAALGHQPPEVSDALSRIGAATDPFTLDEDYDTIVGHAGPLCADVERPT